MQVVLFWGIFLVMDKVTFFQQALQSLGDREYKRDSQTGKACDLWFPTVMHEALNFGAWSFASRSVELESDGDGVYLLPEDCLRPLKVDAPRFRIEGRRVFLEGLRFNGDRRLYVRYVSNALAKAEFLPETQPLFVRGVCLLLAARIAPKITAEPQLAMSLEQMAMVALGEALHKDALSQFSNDQHPLADIINSSIIF